MKSKLSAEGQRAYDALVALYARTPMSNVPRKALKAAALLGDKNAIKELQQMSDNLRWAFIITVIVGAMTTAGFFSWQGCVTNTAVQEQRKMVEAKSAADLEMAQLKAAHELRLQFVQRCVLDPGQAERVVPVETRMQQAPAQ